MSVLVNKPSQLSAATGTATVTVDLVLLETKVNTLTVHPRWKNKANWKSVEFIYENAAKQRYKIVFKIDQNKLSFTIDFPANTRDGMFSCVDLNIAGYNSDFLEIDRSQFLAMFGSTNIFDINVIEGYGYVAPPPPPEAPFITSIIPPTNGNYVTGENILFTVIFSKPVYRWSAPTLTISRIGETSTYFTATYFSGEGTDTFVFRYNVASSLSLTAPNGIEIRSPIVPNLSLRDVPIFTPNSTAAILTFANIQLPLVTVNANLQVFDFLQGTALANVAGPVTTAGRTLSHFSYPSSYGYTHAYSNSNNALYDDDRVNVNLNNPVFDFSNSQAILDPLNGVNVSLKQYSELDQVNPLISLNDGYRNQNPTYLSSHSSQKIAGEIIKGSYKYVIEQRNTSNTLTIRIHQINLSSNTIDTSTVFKELIINNCYIRNLSSSSTGTWGEKAVKKAGVINIANNENPAINSTTGTGILRNPSCILLLGASMFSADLSYGDVVMSYLYTENFYDWSLMMSYQFGSSVAQEYLKPWAVCDYIDNWQSARLMTVSNGRYVYASISPHSSGTFPTIYTSIGGHFWNANPVDPSPNPVGYTGSNGITEDVYQAISITPPQPNYPTVKYIPWHLGLTSTVNYVESKQAHVFGNSRSWVRRVNKL